MKKKEKWHFHNLLARRQRRELKKCPREVETFRDIKVMVCICQKLEGASMMKRRRDKLIS
jgi:hypothetical protein